MMDILIIFAAHCIADFPMQGGFVSKNKSKSFYILLCHCAIYTFFMIGGICLVAHLHGVLHTVDWNFVLAILFYSHFIIDYIKCRYRTHLYNGDEIDVDVDMDGRQQKDYKIWKKDKLVFYYDQIAHLVVAYAILACI